MSCPTLTSGVNEAARDKQYYDGAYPWGEPISGELEWIGPAEASVWEEVQLKAQGGDLVLAFPVNFDAAFDGWVEGYDLPIVGFVDGEAEVQTALTGPAALTPSVKLVDLRAEVPDWDDENAEEHADDDA